jgi:hypothetical protein
MAVPLIVALGRAVPINHSVEVTQAGHAFSIGELQQNPMTTQPRLFWPGNRRRSAITIYAPVDSEGVYIGGDSSVIPEWGAYLPPGQMFKITAYYGPIWVIAQKGLQQVFVIET